MSQWKKACSKMRGERGRTTSRWGAQARARCYLLQEAEFEEQRKEPLVLVLPIWFSSAVVQAL